MRFAPCASLTVSLKSIALSACPLFLRKYTDRIEASLLGYRLARGAFWSLGGAVPHAWRFALRAAALSGHGPRNGRATQQCGCRPALDRASSQTNSGHFMRFTPDR